MRDLAIDRTHLMAALQDAAFFAEVPAIAFLQDAAKGATEHWQAAVKAGTCGTCRGYDFNYYRGVVDAVWLWLRERRAEGDREALQSFKAYFASRKHSPVRSVTIYYRRSRTQGPIAKLTI